MTHELGPAARALLDAAREGLTPPPAALQRVRGKLDASVATSAASGLVTKLGMLAMVAAVATAALVIAIEPRELAMPAIEPPPSARVEARGLALANESAPPQRPIEGPLAAIDTPIASPTETPVAEPIEMPAMAARAQRTPVIAPPQATPPPTPPSNADLAREVELVDTAMAALRRHEPTAALAAVRLHATETAGRGQLAEDAAAIEIEALCQLHDPRVAARLDAFDARWPQSAQRSRLTTSCSDRTR